MADEPRQPLLTAAGEDAAVHDILSTGRRLAEAVGPDMPQATVALHITIDGAQVIAAYQKRMLGGTLAAGGRVTFTKVGRITPEGFIVWTREADE